MMSSDSLIQPSRLFAYVVADAWVAVVLAVVVAAADFRVLVPTVSVRPVRRWLGSFPMTARFAVYSFFQPPLDGYFFAILVSVSPATTL